MDTKTFLFDLRACSFNHERGIPTYAQALLLQFCKDNPLHRYLFWVDSEASRPSRHAELDPFGSWHTEDSLSKHLGFRIDVLVTTVIFQSLHRRGGEYLFPDWLSPHAPMRIGIVYDLIPWIFPDHYLHSEGLRKEYKESFDALRRYDRLLAISEATRQDTIRMACVDPAKIRCLPGDIDDRKRAILSGQVSPALRSGFELSSPYAVYVGGSDWRKNLEGLIREFATFHSKRPEWSLAVVCAMTDERRESYRNLARAHGIPDNHVVFTGLVSDETLISLLQGARVMVFPSFYEGLGLPILESYAAGIPVLGSDNSSIRDLVPPICRFDPGTRGSIAHAMEAFTLDPGIAEVSLAHGRSALACLGWDKSSAIFAEALGPLQSIPATPGNPTIAVAGCLPPATSGIARYNLNGLQSSDWITHFFADLPLEKQRLGRHLPGLLPGNALFPSALTAFALRHNGYAHSIFVLGDSSHNLPALEAYLANRFQDGPPRWLYLHEASLHSLWKAYFGDSLDRVERFYQLHDADWHGGNHTSRRTPSGATGPRGIQALLRLARPHGILVNSNACREMVKRELGPAFSDVPIEVLFLPVEKPPRAARRPERLHHEELKVAHFGVLGKQKHPELLLAAIKRLAKSRPVSVTFAGFGVRDYCAKHKLDTSPFVKILDSPSDAAIRDVMSDIHVAVQLRFPTSGESSAVVGELIAMGKPLIVTDTGSFSDYPDALVQRVAPEVSSGKLAQVIERAAVHEPDPEMREAFLAAFSQQAFSRRLAHILDVTPVKRPPCLSAAAEAGALPCWTQLMPLLSHNKVCNLEDFSDASLLPVLRDVFHHELDRFGSAFPEGREYRKYWEVAMAVRAIQAGGALRPNAEILGVGAGNEPTLFYLTNHVRRVFATDLYLSEGWEESANATMLTCPERHYPSRWNPRRLVVQHMDGTNLRYEDACMDAVFSSSSIEHFGGWDTIDQALREIHRVLKPGGIASISTEYLVAGPEGGCPGMQLFDSASILRRVVDAFDWTPISPLDFSVSEATLATEASFEEVAADQKAQTDRLGGHFSFLITYARYPHILLRLGDRAFTSIHLALRKT